MTTDQPADLAPGYEPCFGATGVDYDAVWEFRRDGRRCTAEQMRGRAILAAWQQMRAHMPREHWSAVTSDAIAEAVLRVVRDWTEAP